MIKVIGLQPLADVDIEVSYTPEVRTYNIISGMMSDDCLPFRVAQHVMVWLNTDGLLGELEAIYPPIVGLSLCTYAEHINEQEGFPRMMVVAVGDEGLLQPTEDGFVVWFAQKRMIDKSLPSKRSLF